jgi:hypothetical protein
MGIYQPSANQTADAAAMSGTLASFEQAIKQTVGNGIISGMAVNINGTISAGYALIGHVLQETGKTSILALATGTGTFDVYVQVPTATYTSSGLAVVGTYPNASGYDTASYAVVSSGVTPAGGGVKLATIVVSGGAIMGVSDKRSFLTTLSSVSAQMTRLCTKETTLYGALTAPLAAPLLFLAPTAMTITGILLAVGTAPVGQAIVAEVQKNGADVWTSGNYPQIAAGAKSGSASNPTGVSSCVQGDIITVNLTQVGTTTPGSTLAVALQYTLA